VEQFHRVRRFAKVRVKNWVAAVSRKANHNLDELGEGCYPVFVTYLSLCMACQSLSRVLCFLPTIYVTTKDIRNTFSPARNGSSGQWP
jgi:hypothetical protein